jgi:hypothetical protein
MIRLSSSDRSEPALARTPGKPINVGFEAFALAVRPVADGDVAAAERPRGRADAGSQLMPTRPGSPVMQPARKPHADGSICAATWAEDALTAMTQNGRSVLAVAVAAEAEVGPSS